MRTAIFNFTLLEVGINEGENSLFWHSILYPAGLGISTLLQELPATIISHKKGERMEFFIMMKEK